MFTKRCLSNLKLQKHLSISRFSTTTNPPPKDLLELLFTKIVKERKSPCFEVYGSQIEILTSPEDYYLALHKLALESQFRINMSALYLGTGTKELFFLERISRRLEENPEIKFNMILDYSRGRRIDKEGKSSENMLLSLLKANFSHKFLRAALFKQPSWMPRADTGPIRMLSEVLGVHHMKAHVFDNNVLITGANLSEDYFTNRQDRCYIIRQSPRVADYFDDLLNALSNCSYHICAGEPKVQKFYPEVSNKNKFKNTLAHHLKLFRWAQKTDIPVGKELECDEFFNGEQQGHPHALLSYDGQDQDLKETVPKHKKPQKDVEEEANEFSKDSKQEDKKKVRDLIQKVNAFSSQKSEPRKKGDLGGRVFIFPALQFNMVNIREDEELFVQILEHLTKKEGAKIDFCSGYLNIMDSYLNPIKSSKAEVNLLTAAPSANGFYKAGFVKKWIPYFYREYEKRILKKSKGNDSVKLYEYQRKNWTYHAKGAWFYEKGNDPNLTVIGSSNYSYRSNRRDTEAQLYIYSQCDDLNARMKEEAEQMFSSAQRVTLDDIKKDKDVKLGSRTYFLSKRLKTLF
ncbi:unnamed protein product [Moneuplotes crassus]|uniref:CDP-diacylglycerol--glycerol-3-phosphate 3-phosphatidyltransferase n=1 Tax=Euplotes crassus TaxID=5936 RepID=A0AAD1U5S6_EUPCR|nr:unnamed protein product [Moneuplotes crassus]